MSDSVAAFLLRHDSGRVAELLPVRYHRMQASAFAFFRGSAPLYYARFGHDPLLLRSPIVWLCGDAHVENFGSFRGNNGLVYVDVNDFDEALRGPALWDVGRLAVSTLLAGQHFGLSPAEQQQITRRMLLTYANTLSQGKAFLLERATAKGVLYKLLKHVARGTPRKLLVGRAGRRPQWHLKESAAIFPLPAHERATLCEALEAWRATQEVPLCGLVLDVAQRVVGIGSLGVPRYLVLAERGSSRKLPMLLDLKLALPPAALHAAGLEQLVWPSEAHRVVQVQTWLQAMPPATLQPLSLGGRQFVLRALQPEEDKLEFTQLFLSKTALQDSLPDFARLLAWAHLRASGHRGAVVPDAVQDFGLAHHEWLEPVLAFAHQAATVVRRDFREFQASYKAGELSFDTPSLARH